MYGMKIHRPSITMASFYLMLQLLSAASIECCVSDIGHRRHTCYSRAASMYSTVTMCAWEWICFVCAWALTLPQLVTLLRVDNALGTMYLIFAYRTLYPACLMVACYVTTLVLLRETWKYEYFDYESMSNTKFDFSPSWNSGCTSKRNIKLAPSVILPWTSHIIDWLNYYFISHTWRNYLFLVESWWTFVGTKAGRTIINTIVGDERAQTGLHALKWSEFRMDLTNIWVCCLVVDRQDPAHVTWYILTPMMTKYEESSHLLGPGTTWAVTFTREYHCITRVCTVHEHDTVLAWRNGSNKITPPTFHHRGSHS